MKKDCNTCLTHKELLVLYDIASLISDSRDIQNSLEKSLMALKNSLQLENSVIYKLDDDVLNIFVSIGFNKHQKVISEYRLGEGATGLAAKSMEPVIIENIHNNILFLNKSGNKNSETISYIAVPLIIENKSVGVLGATLTKATQINFEESIKILSIVSSLFAHYINSNTAIELEKDKLKELKLYYKMEWDSKVHNFGDIIGESEEMQSMYKLIDRIAGSDVSVLVRGETGTGKELVASAIHKRSPRKEEPFIKLNCAAITDSLLESELFGHQKGAFTDAKETRKGRFELADGGTLFLDEIGDISSSAQVKLLRVLQEREFERVGGSTTIHVNVRLIAATNRDLEKMVKDGEFREDLYYRLNVIPIDLPPLRKRGDDIKLLVNFFLERSIKNHKKIVQITDEAMIKLMNYPWPGNVRELENTVERVVLMGSEDGISAKEMSLLLPALNHTQDIDEGVSFSIENKTLKEVEKETLIYTLYSTNNNQAEAAKKLGISQIEIEYKMNKYDL